MTRKINLAGLLIRMGEVLLALVGLGDHSIGKGGLSLRCHSGHGEEGMAKSDLVEVEFIGPGNFDVEMSMKRQESKITPKLRAWVTGRMAVP